MDKEREKILEELRESATKYDKALIAVLREPSEDKWDKLRDERDKARMVCACTQLKLEVYDAIKNSDRLGNQE